MVNLKSGTILFYAPYESQEDVEEAKRYCAMCGLTPNDVSIEIIYEDKEKTKKNGVRVVKK